MDANRCTLKGDEKMNKRKQPLLFKVLVICQLTIAVIGLTGIFPTTSQASEMTTDVGLVFEGEESADFLSETETDDSIQEFIDNLITRLPQTGEAKMGIFLFFSGLLCVVVSVYGVIISKRRQSKRRETDDH